MAVAQLEDRPAALPGVGHGSRSAANPSLSSNCPESRRERAWLSMARREDIPCGVVHAFAWMACNHFAAPWLSVDGPAVSSSAGDILDLQRV